jgi:uncharacterized protein YdhG (YjbR/CyaY superfamily)
MPAKSVDEYLATVPEEARATLEKLRQTIKSILPDAIETISYGMPSYKYKGKLVAGFAAFKEHCSYFPMSAVVIEVLKDDLRSYSTSKGTIRFPTDKPLPATLIKKLIKTRIAETQQK